MEIKDDSGEIKDSPIMKSRMSLEEDVENRMSNSSSDEMDCESSEENLNIKGYSNASTSINMSIHIFMHYSFAGLCQ